MEESISTPSARAATSSEARTPSAAGSTSNFLAECIAASDGSDYALWLCGWENYPGERPMRDGLPVLPNCFDVHTEEDYDNCREEALERGIYYPTEEELDSQDEQGVADGPGSTEATGEPSPAGTTATAEPASSDTPSAPPAVE